MMGDVIMNNKFIYFNYGDGWMILLYENGKNTKYWNDAEDYYDDVCWIIKKTGYETVEIKVKDYDELEDYLDEHGIDVFNLTEENIEELKSRFHVKE